MDMNRFVFRCLVLRGLNLLMTMVMLPSISWQEPHKKFGKEVEDFINNYTDQELKNKS